MTEIERIANSIKQTYNGEAWHGPSLMEVLSKIPLEQSAARIGTSHSIIELVLHMVAWRTFALQKLNGNEDYDVTEAENFPKSVDWQGALNLLDDSQNDLLAALANFNDDKLSGIVPGRNYTFYKLLHGIVEHDIYHQGQITMIIKQF